MTDARMKTANVLGAFAVNLADCIQRAADNVAPEAGCASSALALLYNKPGLSIERLRRAIHLSHPGTVRLVDRMEHRGLLRRAPSPRDGRALELYLTTEGVKAAETVLRARQTVLEDALSGLSGEDISLLTGLLDRLTAGRFGDMDRAYAFCRLCDGEACLECPIEEQLLAAQ